MKTGKFTLAIAVAAMIAACSKEDSIDSESSQTSPTVRAAANPVAIVTAWESGYSWNLSDSADYRVYSYNRAFPEISADIAANGAVLVYVKNYATVEGGRMDKPMLTPIHVLPAIGRPGYDQMWYRIVKQGNVEVKYRTNKHKYGGAVELPDASVQFRYFIIPASELPKLGHTVATIGQLSYADLTQLLGAGQ
jgi:hypothetical protein